MHLIKSGSEFIKAGCAEVVLVIPAMEIHRPLDHRPIGHWTCEIHHGLWIMAYGSPAKLMNKQTSEQASERLIERARQ